MMDRDWKIERFEVFHAENPHVYALFEQFTMHAINRGHAHLSVGMIFDRMRWETQIETQDEDGFKINDIYQPFYSRLFMHEHPEYEGFFRMRRSVADEVNYES